MIKLAYKLLALLFGVLGAMLAGKVFEAVWGRIGHGDSAPDPDQKDADWGSVLLAATLHGAIFAAVKAVVQRGGARGVEKATGVWPGKTAEDAA